MARQWYRVVQGFSTADGSWSGVLDTAVNSRKAVDVQLEANAYWLKNKGHVLDSTEVTPTTKPS